MRLTLRTLLAYLDGLLESQQSDELAAKINDSEFATDLVYRTLTASRNPAVTSPSWTAAGSVQTRIASPSIWTTHSKNPESTNLSEFVWTRICIWRK